MKLLRFVLLTVFVFAVAMLCLHAQTPADASLQAAMSGGGISDATGIDPELQAAIKEAVKATVGPQYEIYVVIISLLVAAWLRYDTARRNGLSPAQAIGATLKGTNVPTNKIPLILACLCMLSLSSCATTSAIIASPFGRAMIATADQLAKRVIETTEQVGLETIIIQATAKAAALNAEGVNADLVKETLRQSQIAAFKAVISAAEEKYQALTGHEFTLPKNPVLITP